MIHSATFDGYKINIPSSFHNYTVLKVIGNGGTCIVALVENQKQEKFSAKIISTKFAQQADILKSINDEIKILKSLDHPNIIKIYESFEIQNDDKEEFIVIITEYCSNGDLLTFTLNGNFENKSTQIKIYKGFFSAIQYLHSKKIAHCDIKGENILLDSNFNPKLCDFGYSQTTIIQNDEFYKRGTIFYLAPELCHPGKYNTLKADIYAIGILLYSLSEKTFPFRDGNDHFIKSQILSGHLRFSNKIDLELLRLVIKCTKMDPNERPSIEDIIKDEYFTEETKIERANNILKINLPFLKLLPNDEKENECSTRSKKLEKYLLQYILKNKDDAIKIEKENKCSFRSKKLEKYLFQYILNNKDDSIKIEKENECSIRSKKLEKYLLQYILKNKDDAVRIENENELEIANSYSTMMIPDKDNNKIKLYQKCKPFILYI